jgi:PAS domain S-box-containing protein
MDQCQGSDEKQPMDKLFQNRTFLPLKFVELIQTISDGLSMAVISTNESGIVVSWNSYAEELYGWTRSEVIGKKISDVTVSPLNSATADAIMDSLATGNAWFGQFDCRRSDSTSLRVQVLDAPVLDELGNFRGVIGFSNEINDGPLEFLRDLEELRDLTEKIDEVQLAEQKRIGVQLHDQLSQPVALAAMELFTFAKDEGIPESMKKDLKRLAVGLQETLTVLQGLSSSLHPNWMNDVAPANALSLLIEDWSRMSGIPVRLVLDQAVKNMDESIALTTLQIVREALENVERHSHADLVAVSVESREGCLRVKIVDNGVGCSDQSGFGIRLMRERARRIGGSLAIGNRSGRQSGTKVEFKVPMFADAPRTTKGDLEATDVPVWPQ